MGACASTVDNEQQNPAEVDTTLDFRQESSFYGKITLHNPKDSMGQMVTVTDKYDFDEDLELGASSTGVVCRAVRKADGEVFAVKVINLKQVDEENRAQLRSEIEILKSLDHPNIVKLFETFEHDMVLYMIMELCTGGELYGRLSASGKRFSEKVASRIVKQMLSAVVYCHSKNIAHRDIKMANFLFKDESSDAPVKMIDFGYSKMMYKMGGSQRLETFVGTSYFIAPEVIAGAYSEKADIWSIGVMCFLMVVGYAPFRGKTPQEIIDNVRKAKINWNTPRWKEASKACLSFTKSLLTVQESKRLSAEEALRHEWLSNSAEKLVPNFSDQMLANMSNFTDMPMLKKLVKVVIAHCAHRDFVQPYHDAFFAIDHDHSGRIDKAEMVAALTEHNGLEGETASSIFDAIDYDSNGTIRFSEFVAAGIGDTFTDAHVKDAFKRLCYARAASTASTPVTPAAASDVSSGDEEAGPSSPRHSSLLDKIITPESLHEAYEEHDVACCRAMIEEATDGKPSMSYQDFYNFMREKDTIVLTDTEDADTPPTPGGKSGNTSPILIRHKRPSRPELLRKISDVVATKPQSNKRRESLRVRSSSNLKALAAEEEQKLLADMGGKGTMRAASEEPRPRPVITSMSSMGTIASVGTDGERSARSSFSPKGSSPNSGEAIVSRAARAVSLAGALELGRAAAIEYRQMQPQGESDWASADSAAHHATGLEAGTDYARAQAAANGRNTNNTPNGCE